MFSRTPPRTLALLLCALWAGTPGVSWADPPRSLPPNAPAGDGWRRTQRGWEHRSQWPMADDRPLPGVTAVHPLLVGLLELFLCCGVLLALSPPSPRRARKHQAGPADSR